MKLLFLSLALVAFVALSEARPQMRTALRAFAKKSAMMRSVKKSMDDVSIGDVLQKLETGFTDEELTALAQICTQEMGEDVTPKDVQDFLDEFGDLVKMVLEMGMKELGIGKLQDLETFLNDPELGDFLDKFFSEQQRKRSLMKKAKDSFGDITVGDVLQKLKTGLTDEELEATAEIITEEFGEDVSAEDVEAFLNEFGDVLILVLEMGMDAFGTGELQLFEDFMNCPELGAYLDEVFADDGSKKRALTTKRTLGGLLDDLDDDDLSNIAGAASDFLGYTVTADDVESFMDSYGEEVEAALLTAAEDLDHDQFQELEDLLEHPDLFEDTMEELSSLIEDKRASKRSLGALLDDLDDDDVSDVAQAAGEYLGHDVSAQDVENFMNQYGDELEAALLEAAEGLDHDQFKEFEDMMAHPDLFEDVMDELKENGLIKKKAFLKRKGKRTV